VNIRNEDDAWRLDGRCLTCGKRRLRLSASESALLGALIGAEGRALSDRALARALGTEASTNIAAVWVMRLRKGFAALGMPNPIVTSRGEGYRWAGGPVEVFEPAVLVPSRATSALHALLRSHPDQAAAEDVHSAIFGV
jgi:DNA-binding winged helix-turn-helix (wHTH) protein